tara:strand:+ start:133 stop:345 length:213 start_codon:yes stop_codon:yes gene_type:complete
MLIDISKDELNTLWDGLGLLRLDYMTEDTIAKQEPDPTLSEEEREFFQKITKLQKKLGNLQNVCTCQEKK